VAEDSSRARRRARILTGNLPRTLIILGLPMLLSGQIFHWIGMVVTWWMGRLAGSEGLAVAAAVAPFEQTVNVIFLAIALGNSVKLARAVGAGAQDGAQLIASAGLLALLVGVVLGMLGAILAPQLVRIVSPEAAIAPGVHHYLIALFLGLPATSLTQVLISSVAATGFTQFGMARLGLELLVIAAVTPLAMSVGFGVAGAPVTAAVAAALLNVLTAAGISRLRVNLGLGSEPAIHAPFRPRYWLEILGLGLPVQAIRISQIVAFGIYIRMLLEADHLSAAGFGIAYRLFALMGNMAWALSRANAIVIGQNLGAGNRDRIVKSLRWTATYTLSFACICLLVIPLCRPVVELFSNDQRVVDEAMRALLRIRLAMVGIFVWQMLVETYMALGSSTRSALLLTLCSFAGVAAALLGEGDPIERATRGMVVDQMLKVVVVCAMLPLSFFGVLRDVRPRSG